MNSIIIGVNVIKRTLRDISSINFLVLFPILAGLIVVIMLGDGGIIDVGVSNVLEDDYGVVKYIDNSNQYNVHFYNENELEGKIENGEIKAGLVQSDLTRLKLLALESDTKIQELRGAIEMYMASSMAGEKIEQNQVDENKNTERSKMAIGMMTMFIIVFAGNSIALLLEDKKLKTFTRMFCAPVKGYETVLGYLVANILLGMVQIMIFLFFTTYIFNIEWGISVVHIFALLFIFMIGAIGLAIGLAGFISDSEKYNMVLMLTGLGTSFLGGSFFPTENLNNFIQRVSNFTPQKWLMESFDVLADGGSFGDIQMNILILLLFGVVLFTFGVKTLKPNPEDL